MTSAPGLGVDHLVLHSSELRKLTRRIPAVAPAGGADALDVAFLAVVGDLPFGVPFTFAEQYGGALVHDVRPAAGRDEERSSRGRVPLGIHTDDAFLVPSARPEFMALLGVSNPERVPTRLVRVDDLVALLDAETIHALGQPWFTFGRPASFEMEDDTSPGLPGRPILRGEWDGALSVSFATRTAVARSAPPEAARCFDAFRAAIERAPRRDVALEPGDVLLFSNSRCLHGRPAIRAERWLKRVYLRRNLGTLERLASTATPRVYSATKAVDAP